MPYNNKGDKNPRWKGGIKHDRGYILIYTPDHPNKVYQNYVYQHRLVMEKYIGRYLNKKEQVHHINGIKNDNRLSNLLLCKNFIEHKKIHYPNNSRFTRHCHKCKKVYKLNHDNFYKCKNIKYGYDYYCKKCKYALGKLYKEKNKKEKNGLSRTQSGIKRLGATKAFSPILKTRQLINHNITPSNS